MLGTGVASASITARNRLMASDLFCHRRFVRAGAHMFSIRAALLTALIVIVLVFIRMASSLHEERLRNTVKKITCHKNLPIISRIAKQIIPKNSCGLSVGALLMSAFIAPAMAKSFACVDYGTICHIWKRLSTNFPRPHGNFSRRR